MPALYNEYIQYMNKCKILGIEPLDITYDNVNDTYKLNSLNILSFEKESSDTIVIDIPDFITDLNIKSDEEEREEFIQENDNAPYNSIIKDINQLKNHNKNIIFNWESFNGKSIKGIFTNLKAKSLTVNINIENIEDMSESFLYAHIEKLKFKDTDTKNLKNIRSMFYCAYIGDMNFNGFNLSNVEDASYTFTDSIIKCEIQLKNMINVRNIDSIFSHARIYDINTAEINLKHIESMACAFYNAQIEMKSTVDLSTCDLSNLIRTQMFLTNSKNIITLNIGKKANLDKFERNAMSYHSDIKAIKFNTEN